MKRSEKTGKTLSTLKHKTSIIILTYNQLDYTKKCIESIRKYTAPDTYEIIVVDNNSTDGTVEWLGQQQDILCISNSENKGFALGCNQGILKAQGNTILLLNNDVVVTQNWLTNMVASLYSRDDIGAVCPVTNFCSYYQSIPVSYKSLDEMQEFASNHNKSNSALWEERLKLVAFCMLLKKEVIHEIGLLDKRFFPANYEDDDYSFRIRFAGYRLMLCKDTFVHHFGSISLKSNPQAHAESLQTNRKRFIDKWGFHPAYSTFVRSDVISLMTHPNDSTLNVLEVGCACGGTLLKIRDKYKHANLFGIELSESAAKSAQLFAKVVVGDVEKAEISYPDFFFDYIIFPDVLEHLKDPWGTLAKIKRFLKPGGKVITSIPNVMHHQVIKNLLYGNWTYEEAGILDRTHLRFFTLKEALRMFEQAGYQNITYGQINANVTEQDKLFISELAKLTNENMIKQYAAYQYIISATIG